VADFTTDTAITRSGSVDPDPSLPDPFRWEGWHIGALLAGGRVLFTTRRGGVSEGAFGSLNLGSRSDDEPARVRANRQLLAAQVGVPWAGFLHGRQVHGNSVRRAAEPPSARRPVHEEDGQATALVEAPALVLVADCLPVALVAEGAVAALHGGWRGLEAGILEEGVAALRDCGVDGPVVAALGPCARPCCYEVGEEVHARFDEPGARSGDRKLDLAAIARARLARAGVLEIHDVGLCTMCAPHLFFSHRRDAGRTGRQAGLAWRDA
jgi:YfiH family protein